MIIYLPFPKPPQEPMTLSGLTLKTAFKTQSGTATDIEHLVTLYYFEAQQLSRMSKKDQLFGTVLQTEDQKIPGSAYVALIDLLSGHWKYVFKRTIALAHSNLLNDSFAELKVPLYNFTPSLLDRLVRGVKLLSSERKAKIALQRWSSSYIRTDPLDTVLDCCSALEAALNLSDELRLRISLSVYHILDKGKKKAFSLIYEMYGVRNSFIHGVSLPDLTVEQQEGYIEVVAHILDNFVKNKKIPNSKSIGKMILRKYGG